MKRQHFLLCFLLMCFAQLSIQLNAQDKPSRAGIQQWKNYRFGLFIHWGPSAGLGTPESHSHARQSPLNPHGSIPAAVYDNLYSRFNPINYDPKVWIDLAYDAGMRYAVFVAKHHDGFNMFDTKQTDYQIMSTPYKKDVAGMFAEAVHQKHMGLGWQFSPKDWKHPDFNTLNHDRYNAYYLNLLSELTTNYGKIDVMWFDGIEPAGKNLWKDAPDQAAIMMYHNQPNIVLGTHGAMTADFISHELGVGPFERNKPWETAEAINPSGWIFNKPMPSFPFRSLLRNLIFTISRDGNYLLDVGPMPDGTIYPPDAERLKDFAGFMKVNAEGVHGTRGGPYRDGLWGGATCKGRNVYLFIADQVGSKLSLPKLPARILKVSRLDSGPVNWKNNGEHFQLEMKDRERGKNPIFVCVKLELDKQAVELPIMEGQTNIAQHAQVTTYLQNGEVNPIGISTYLFDDDGETAWESDVQDSICSMIFDFNKKERVTALSMAEKGQVLHWSHWLDAKLFYFDERNDKWELAYHHNGMLGSPPMLEFPNVETARMKIEFRKKPTYALQLAELRLFGPLED